MNALARQALPVLTRTLVGDAEHPRCMWRLGLVSPGECLESVASPGAIVTQLRETLQKDLNREKK